MRYDLEAQYAAAVRREFNALTDDQRNQMMSATPALYFSCAYFAAHPDVVQNVRRSIFRRSR